MNAKIWMLQTPPGSRYAELLSLHVEPDTIECAACRRAPSPPLRVEWDDGSSDIGDFTNAGGRLVVRENVGREIMGRFSGARLRDIEMFDHPKLYRPTESLRRLPERVWLPYEGPPLKEFVVSKSVETDPSSSRPLLRVCDVCGSKIYGRMEGVEVHNSARRVPRVPGKGLFIKGAELEGHDFFRPHRTSLVLCNDNAKAFIEERGYTNIECLEWGDIIYEGVSHRG